MSTFVCIRFILDLVLTEKFEVFVSTLLFTVGAIEYRVVLVYLKWVEALVVYLD